MADTYQSYSNAGQTTFSVPFPYLNKSHVKVTKGRDILADTQTATLSETSDYTFNASGTQITLASALGSGEILTIERQTPSASQLSPWSDGSNLTAEELNNADLQNLYIVQEQKDKNSLGATKSIAAETASTNATTSATNAVNTANAALPKAGGTMTGAIAMGTNKITGVGDPTAAQDAVTKAYLERTGSIASAQIADGTIVNNDVNASAAIAQSKLDIANATTSASGYMSAADKTKLEGCDTGAKDDQTAAEIRVLVDGATNSNVYTDAEKTKLAGCDTGAKDDQTASEIKALYEDSGNNNASYIKTQYESNAQTNPLTDAEKAVIDGVTANTSELNKLDGVTASTTELNIVAGKSFRASSDGALSTTSDTEMPSSKVVANHVAAQIGTVGGFTTIANDASFPATASQPATGVIVSISDAQGVAVSGTTSTTGRTVDGTPATVTINNFPSSLTGETLASGVGLLVTSTGSGNIYNYHKLLAAETDVKQLSDDINDFNARYRVAGSPPGSNNDEGDLYFDTAANKMKVYNGSAWDDVASVGSFFVNTLSSSSSTGGGSATFNGSAYRFTLSNAGSSAQQHIVSVNGVVQKPNSGTSQPSEGFAISGNDIIFSAAPASGSDFFIITCGSSVSIGTPSANSVNSSHIIDGSIVDGDISNSANIAGSKVADDSIPEVKLDIHNAPATGKYLKHTSNGMEWADGASEGTDVKSTGESGTTKFLRVDGDGTCSWQVPPDTNTQLTLNDEDNFASNSATAAASQQSIKAYVDTQVGSISAAPEITATADGAIAANKPVRVNEDGTISEIKNTALSAATGSNTDIPHSIYTPIVKAAVFISSTKFVLFWITDNNNDKLNAAVGTVSGTTITYGSREEIATNTGVTWVSAAYDSTADAVICAFAAGSRYVKGLKISGTTITVNSTGFVDHDNSENLAIASDNKGGFIMQWVNTSDQWYGTGGTISATGAIACGSHVHIANSRTSTADIKTFDICYDKDTDQWVSLARFSGGLTYQICTRSGTTMTITGNSTPPQLVANVADKFISLNYDEINKQFILFFRHSSSHNLNYKTTRMGTGNTSLTGGNSGALFTCRLDPMGYGTFDKGSGKAFFMFCDDLSSPADTKLLTVSFSGTGGHTASATSEQLASHKEQHGQAIATNGEGLILTAVDKSDDSDVLSRVKQLAVTVSNLKGDSFIGFATAAISDSASGTVAVTGNTTTQSGLTPSKKYYVQKGGTVATAADDPSVVAGIAVSSTKLLIKG